MARFQPDLLKRLDSTLNVVARDLKAGAQSNLARTGMTGSAYRVRTRTRAYGFSKGVTTVPGSVGPHEKWSSEPGVLARIFELAAGVRNARPENVKRTRSLIDTLNARYGSPGRFLWEAWDAKKDSYMGAVGSEIKAVEAEYTARMT
jgi:hypothetical protein